MEPFFLPTPEGQIYALYLPALTPVRGAMLWLPPFAEEAHCSRRHMLAAARECQQRGYASLFVDLYGTGESDGDFAQATWPIWLHDVQAAADCLRQRVDVPLWLVGVRAGSLLASDAVATVRPHGMLCWQPVSAGRGVVDSFLRLKLASEWVGAGDESAGTILADLRDKLTQGAAVDVAGFTLSAELASVLAQRGMSWSSADCKRMACIEFRSHQQGGGVPDHTPGFARQCENWRALGVQLESVVLEAPQFWWQHEAMLTRGLGNASMALIERLP